MLLTETEGKALLSAAGVAVPAGVTLRSPAGLKRLKLPFPVAVKAQVASGGRGKAGGVRRASDLAEAEKASEAILATRFQGEKPRALLVERWLDVAREVYLSVTIDGRAGGYVLLYASLGGVEIESEPPPLRYEIGAPRNFRAAALRQLIEPAESDPSLRERIVALARRLLFLAVSRDCTTVEINPLLLLKDGSLIAGDAKVVRDDSAAYRQGDIAAALAAQKAREDTDVRRCQEANLMLVWLEGSIGLLSSGAGMTMAAMDAIESAGGKPACFLDCSGNPTPAGFDLAFHLLDRKPQVQAILVSMFGGGLQMDRVARTLTDLMARRRSAKPVIFRLNGTNADKASALLDDKGLVNYPTLELAVAAAVAGAPA